MLYSPDGLARLIQLGGLYGLAAIVFAETGLLLGFFLPGDSLLVTAGIFASPKSFGGGLFDPLSLITTLITAAIIGDQLNYFLGSKAGSAVFSRADGRIIKKRYFKEAHDFYERHGRSAIILARFVPVIRTFVPFIAGVAKMPHRRFTAVSVIADIVWVTSLVMIGYFIGQTPLAAKLHHVILVVVAVSLLPIIIGIIKKACTPRSSAAD
jgi:membrane-associated protein